MTALIKNLFKKNQIWSTYLFRSTSDDNFISLIEKINKGLPYLNRLGDKKIEFSKSRLHTIADPFLVVDKNNLYLIAETQRTKELGKISAWLWNEQNSKWNSLGIILEEKFHLSFPNVFKVNNTFYMLPECGSNNTISIYKFSDFPLNLEHTPSIHVANGAFVDSAYVYHEGLHYVITSNEKFELHIFYSKTIEGPWNAHNQNPILQSEAIARNGGTIINKGGELFRIAQNCSNLYGENISILKITALTPADYKEDLIHENIISKSKMNQLGSHHLSIATHDNQLFMTIDGQQHDFFFNKIISLIRKVI